MITAIYSLSRVYGAELWLLFWLICVVIYLAIGLFIKNNRTGNGVKNVLIGLLIAEAITDLMWAAIYYHNGTYLNHDIGAVYGVFLWVPILVITLVIVTLKKQTNRKVSKS